MLNKLIVFLGIIIFISSCTTHKTYVGMKEFPSIPEELLVECEYLSLADEVDPRLSNLLEVTLENYQKYMECSSKVSLFSQWYYEQRDIHNKSLGNKKDDNNTKNIKINFTK